MSRWKQTVNQKDNYWWQVGMNKANPLHLPKMYVHVYKETEYVQKEFPGHNWTVQAPTRINPDTINGHFLSFKTREEAMQFAKSYMRKH